MRALRIAASLAVVLAITSLAGCGGCTQGEKNYSVRISAPSQPVVVDAPAAFRAVVRNANGDEVVAGVDWTVKDNPVGASISNMGVFVAHRPGQYTVDADFNGAGDQHTFTVSNPSPTSSPATSTTASDGVSFSVDESSSASGGDVGTLAGTYEGTMPLIFGSQKATVPFTLTVDSAGKVSGRFRHVWKPMNGIKSTLNATFSGTVTADGKLTAAGTATSSGTNQGQPYSTPPNRLSVGGQITGTHFVGGLSGSQDWTAERK
jgi:hypothetical protein